MQCGDQPVSLLCVATQVFAYDIERLWRQIWKGNAIGHMLCKGRGTKSTVDEFTRSFLAGFAVKDKVRVRPAGRVLKSWRNRHRVVIFYKACGSKLY